MPDAGATETGHHRRELQPLGGFGIDKVACCLGRFFHLFRGALADPFRVPIFPDVGRHDRLVPLIDIVANRLPNQMVGDRECGKPVVR